MALAYTPTVMDFEQISYGKNSLYFEALFNYQDRITKL